jgi:hypothetical protein
MPHNACYRAHCGGTWVWVTPECTKALADFTLILQDIARVDINSSTIFFIRPKPSDFQFKCIASRICEQGPYSNVAPGLVAEVSVDPCGNLVPDVSYYKLRVENVGSDAALRSQISAAAASLH